MNVSVALTVRNEEGTIKALLDSLLSQSKFPTEVIIVDGGSTDRTTKIIRSYEKRFTNMHLIIDPGSIAHGRNMAIRSANYEIVAQIDAGCVADEYWLENLTDPFRDPKVQMVAGFYEMTGKSVFQKAASLFLGTPPQRFDPRCFMPSSRSVAFRKKVWEKVGGYNEKLDRAGEDTLFNYEVIKHNVNMFRQPNAIVYWEVPKTLKELSKKFFYYAKGDAQAGIWWHPAQKLATHNLKISLIFARYLVGMILLSASVYAPILRLILILGFITYLFWSMYKLEDVIDDMRVKFWVPVLQITSDLCVMLGFIAGTI